MECNNSKKLRLSAHRQQGTSKDTKRNKQLSSGSGLTVDCGGRGDLGGEEGGTPWNGVPRGI